MYRRHLDSLVTCHVVYKRNQSIYPDKQSSTDELILVVQRTNTCQKLRYTVMHADTIEGEENIGCRKGQDKVLHEREFWWRTTFVKVVLDL